MTRRDTWARPELERRVLALTAAAAHGDAEGLAALVEALTPTERDEALMAFACDAALLLASVPSRATTGDVIAGRLLELTRDP